MLNVRVGGMINEPIVEALLNLLKFPHTVS
jgi:hypothetical protein